MSEKEMFELCEVARRQAYAPYSNFPVGAVLIGTNGEAFSGANVENVSFGLTMCAERVALGTAILSRVRSFSLLALLTDSKQPVVPCGGCRQVLAEFSPSLRIVSRTVAGTAQEFQLQELLPLPRQGILQ